MTLKCIVLLQYVVLYLHIYLVSGRRCIVGCKTFIKCANGYCEHTFVILISPI